MNYKTKEVCATEIKFDIVDDKLINVNFTGGCNGNLKAIAVLVEGMPINEVIQKLKGNSCGPRSTSCTDQLVLAIETYSK
ncbi:MAG: TIGR03905 family TSCPD domain-containing protein [Fusobacteria bacterium]|nr:TIGR03905 family TSCPD domain-containing protein [Fusobacteriota bacterium]